MLYISGTADGLQFQAQTAGHFPQTTQVRFPRSAAGVHITETFNLKSCIVLVAGW